MSLLLPSEPHWRVPEAERDTFSVSRSEAPQARFSLLGEMMVERGDKSDWMLLHDLHYKAEALPMGPQFWKLTLAGETVGVMVIGLPKGLLRPRHQLFPKLKPASGDTPLINRQRYNYLNDNFRVVSRFVIDTMYRGIGAGYRMMNLVSRMDGHRFMEIQSSMSKFNLFGQKAGFRFAKPENALQFDAGMRFFRHHFQANPQDIEEVIAEIEALPPDLRARKLQACKDFYYAKSPLEKTGNNAENGAARVEAMDARQTIKALQQIVLASPLYGVWQNPDFGRTLPPALPLTAFDAQEPNEPFRWTP